MSGGTRLHVRPGDPALLGELLARHGEPGAAAEGRAFVNGRRAGPAEPVAAGDEVVTYAARTGGGADEVRLLLESDGLVVAHKPAALPTTPDRRGAASLTGEVARLLGVPEVHAASRLDAGVSGAVLCAVGARAQKHVAALQAEGGVRRRYVALASGRVAGEGTWDAPIGRVSTPTGRSRPTAGGRDALAASTSFRALASLATPPVTMLALEPETGRMHQLRAHAAAARAPLLGDREHGGPRAVGTPTGRVLPVARVALHALSVGLVDLAGRPLEVASPVPADLRALWLALGGDDLAWPGPPAS